LEESTTAGIGSSLRESRRYRWSN